MSNRWKHSWRVVLFALACFVSIAVAVDESSSQRGVLYAQGNTAFLEGRFADAESAYRSLVKQGEFSEDVFFNLGNAIYRQDRPGEAALWFQRARVFSPRMAEANQNLAFLEKTQGFLAEEREPLDAFLFRRSPAELTTLMWCGGWVFFLSIAAVVVIRRLRDWRPLLIILGLFGLALGIAAGWAGHHRAESLAVDNFAIVIGSDVSALTAPAPAAEPVISLPPGSEVQIVRDRGAWKYIEIPGELRGWVDSDSVEAIWPIQ